MARIGWRAGRRPAVSVRGSVGWDDAMGSRDALLAHYRELQERCTAVRVRECIARIRSGGIRMMNANREFTPNRGDACAGATLALAMIPPPSVVIPAGGPVGGGGAAAPASGAGSRGTTPGSGLVSELLRTCYAAPRRQAARRSCAAGHRPRRGAAGRYA